MLKPGQFITGRRSASKMLKFKSKMWDRKRDVLENLEILTKQVTNQWTLITIINWEKYQLREDEVDQASDQPMTSGRPADDHRQEGEEDHHVSKVIDIDKHKVIKGRPQRVRDILKSPQKSSQTLSPSVTNNGKYPSADQIYAALLAFFRGIGRATGIEARWPRDTTTKKHCLTMQQRGHSRSELEKAFQLLTKKYKGEGSLRLTNRRFSPGWELMDKLQFVRQKEG